MIENKITDASLFLNDASSYALLHWINTHLHEMGLPFAQWHNNTLRVGDDVAHPGDWIVRRGDGSFSVVGKAHIILLPDLPPVDKNTLCDK